MPGIGKDDEFLCKMSSRSQNLRANHFLVPKFQDNCIKSGYKQDDVFDNKII